MRKPRWNLVALFYVLALGWVSLVAVALYAFGARSFAMGGVAQVFQLALGVFYMPAPMVAALIVERVAGEGYFIRETFRGFWRKLPRLLLVGVGVTVGTFAALTGLTWLLGALGVPGIGRLIWTSEELVAHFREVFGPDVVQSTLEGGAGMPSAVNILLVALVGAIVAGFTMNALFAFGEEYGWRGWLMNELRPMGPVRANVLTGALWGLWHTPIIWLGFNYAPYNLIGPLFMVVLCVPFSFLLWRMREYEGSVLAACVGHGAFNGFAGAFVLVLAARNPLLGAPTGLIGAASIGIVAAVLWVLTQGRLWPTETDQRDQG